MDTTTGRVVVGFDASEAARAAVDHAAELAVRVGRPLTILHAHRVPTHTFSPGLDPSDLLHEGFRSAAQELAAAVVITTRAEHPGLEVDERMVLGSAASALADASGRAHAVVIGTRGLGVLSAVLRGGVGDRLLTASPCPVYVVPATTDATPGTRNNPVVLVTDGEQSSAAAELAFETAAGLGRPLLAVIVQRLGEGAGWTPLDLPDDLVRADLEQQVSRTLRPVWARFPEVDAQIRVVAGDPVEAIASESAAAALVVIGSRGQGSLRGLVRGSTGRRALSRIAGPVCVVRAAEVSTA